jgi:hypothetical protein
MIGCLMLFPFAGLATLMGVYATSLMAFFAALAAAWGLYMSAITAYFTAFFIWMFG